MTGAEAGGAAAACAGISGATARDGAAWLEQASTSAVPTASAALLACNRRRPIQDKVRQHTLQSARANALDAQELRRGLESF